MPEIPEPAPAAQLARTLVENHRAFLGFVERRVASRADAEEILQAAFVRGLEKADTIADEESTIAWFYRLLRNAVIDHYRRQATRDGARQRLLAEHEESALDAPDARATICSCVSALAATLAPEYEAVLRRVDLDEAAVGDVARELGISANHASVRLHRARATLRRRVAQACGTCAEHGCLDCHCKPG
jgi:RNA polymerase sigma factor (sigma-70 family)